MVTKSWKIILGIIAAGIVVGIVASLPITKVLLGSYPVSLADIARRESHPE